MYIFYKEKMIGSSNKLKIKNYIKPIQLVHNRVKIETSNKKFNIMIKPLNS
jgi:hypothetical protein